MTKRAKILEELRRRVLLGRAMHIVGRGLTPDFDTISSGLDDLPEDALRAEADPIRNRDAVLAPDHWAELRGKTDEQGHACVIPAGQR